ncbi:transmembrane protein 241-like isoform X1 [Lytechinus variegatus]|uniref:transmembrane protein 241-like isoform X1 n=1 Tax=Lytechinus variegatus TaxID=7654 RepID=UPI001BB12031|nr:transmembrane protein 241-like isoform X1 [Lytechinus variegatus]
MASLWLPILYCILYICTVLVNKYVLWVLGFTYPTLFQGWQTLVGFLVLRFVASLGHIELSSNISSSAYFQWLPAMVLFVCGIYSGSRALARLPIPIFLCLQGQVEVITSIVAALIHKQNPKPQVACSWLIMTASGITIWLTDPQYDQNGYKWMFLHVIVSSQSAIYMKWQKTFLMNDVDRLHCIYAFSVCVFAPGSFILGDLMSSSNFRFWYMHHFYVGCLMSGILGVTLALCHLYMKHVFPDFVLSLTISASKILCVVISTLIYLTVFNTHFFLSIFFCLAGQLIHSIAKHDGSVDRLSSNIDDDDLMGPKLEKEQA